MEQPNTDASGEQQEHESHSLGEYLMDTPVAPAEEPAPSEPPPEEPTILLAPESHESRTHLASWFERFLLVLLALAAFKCFQAVFAGAATSSASSLHQLVADLRNFILSVPDRMSLFTAPRDAAAGIGRIAPIERVGLGLLGLLLAARLLIRVRLLSAVFVRSGRWAERTMPGLILLFLMLVPQAILIAWAASLARTPTASDGLVIGLLMLWLIVGAVWFFLLHLMTQSEQTKLLPHAIAEALFALLLLLVLLWPGVAVLWNRLGAALVLVLIESFIAFRAGGDLLREPKTERSGWRMTLYVVICSVIVILSAGLLAIVR